MIRPKAVPTFTPELDQLAIALALGKFARVLEQGFTGENAEQQVKIIRGVSYALEKLKMYSQCFAIGHSAHPFPASGKDNSWMSNARADASEMHLRAMAQKRKRRLNVKAPENISEEICGEINQEESEHEQAD